MNKDYHRLFSLARETKTLDSISELIEWDQETMLPAAGTPFRAEQQMLLAKLIHKGKTGKAFEKALSKLIDLESGKVLQKGLSFNEEAALREWRRDFLLATKLPSKFVEEFAQLSSEAMEVWKHAREENAFFRFAPYLDRIVHMNREKAERFGYTDHPYDALIDIYEPEMTKKKAGALFRELKPVLTKIRQSMPTPKADFLTKSYAHGKQMDVAKKLLKSVGCSEERARLDLATHPFCINPHPTDGRITTRVNVHDPLENFLATLHEWGHCLYESHLPEEHFGSPLCEALSMAVHESQSRWWEIWVGQSLPFWKYFFPTVKKAFPKQLERVSVNKFHQAVNRRIDTPIRINSDEVSYPLHIILRFEIECDLIGDKLSIRDIPDAWNAKMEESLGITPKNDREGCLQDVHWSCGAMGYFPTYAIGNLYAAQFFQTFAKEHPDWEARVAKGDFFFMRDWLRENIHHHGRTYTPPELIKRVTGKALSAKPYLKYLQKKYA